MDKQQLLIVDDEEVNRAILSMMFKHDYEVLEASDGEKAIRQIEKCEDLALILLDVVMPVMDGFRVLDYMKEKALLEKIPVILITSMTPQESVSVRHRGCYAQAFRTECDYAARE